MPAVAFSDHHNDSDPPQQAVMESVLEMTNRALARLAIRVRH